MISSCLRVIFMKIKNLKKDAIQAIEKQALNHVFFATNIDNNLEFVKRFEQEEGICFLSQEQVLSYFNLLERDHLLFPEVLKNGYDYAEYLDDFSGDFLKNSLRVKKVSSHQEEMVRRFYQCDGFFDIMKALLEVESVSLSKVKSFTEGEFPITREVLRDSIDHDSLLYKRAFLKYCQILLKSNSPLIHDKMFHHELMRVLRFNQMYREFNGCSEELPTLNESFFQANQRLARKMSRVAID